MSPIVANVVVQVILIVVAYFAVALAIGLVTGPYLRRAREERTRPRR